jgi:hypothetical protein
MSAKPTHDLCIKTGEYQDRETGQTKGRWLTIGTVFKHDDGGTSIKLDCIPVGLKDWEGWVNVFPRDRQQGQGQQGNGRQQGQGQGYQGQQQGQQQQYPSQQYGVNQPAPQRQAQGPQKTFDDEIPF